MAVGDWPIDATVTHRGFGVDGGLPQTGHPRRCQSRNRWREQCRQWASHGSRHCRFHGGAKRCGREVKHVPWYGRRAGSKLREALEEYRKSGGELLRLDEEVELARLLADQSFAAFEAACLDEDGRKKTSDDLKAMAVVQARSALSHVTEVVERACKVKALSSATVSAEDIALLAQKMEETVRRTLEKQGVQESVVKAVCDAISDMDIPNKPGVQVVIS